MKRICALVLPVMMVVTCAIVFAQDGGGGRGGGQGRGAGGPGGGGGRGAPAAPATGPIADWVAKMAAALNKGDAAELNKMVTADAMWVDEDGHFPPVNIWIQRLTSSPKTLTVLTAPTALSVKEMGDTAIAAFNFSLKETVTQRGQTTGTPNEMLGIASIVLKKDGNDWKAFVIHAAAKGTAIQTH